MLKYKKKNTFSSQYNVRCITSKRGLGLLFNTCYLTCDLFRLINRYLNIQSKKIPSSTKPTKQINQFDTNLIQFSK